MLDMGIIKVEIKLSEINQAIEAFRNNRLKVFEDIGHEIKTAVSHTLNQLLKTEMTLFLGSPDQKLNKRNGYIEREYGLKGVGCIRVKMPVDRHHQFKSAIIPHREQIDPRLKEDLALLHVAGISNRTLAMISNRLLGVKVSADTVNQSLKLIEPAALSWLSRPLEEEYWALYVDGTNFRMQGKYSTEKEPCLVVLGINEKNQTSILAIEPGQKDDASCWEQVFKDLKKRGLKGHRVRIGVMDGLPGLEKKFVEAFPKAQSARCWVHALRNALAKTPKKLSDSFKTLSHKVMYAASEDEARVAFGNLKRFMQDQAGRAVACLEKDLDSLLVHYRFEKTLWRALKTTNLIERVNKELKRRVKSMESLSERTLNILMAFTALRLEYNWRRVPVDAPQLKHLKPIKRNEIELTMEKLTA
jgi:putative transposase